MKFCSQVEFLLEGKVCINNISTSDHGNIFSMLIIYQYMMRKVYV